MLSREGLDFEGVHSILDECRESVCREGEGVFESNSHSAIGVRSLERWDWSPMLVFEICQEDRTGNWLSRQPFLRGRVPGGEAEDVSGEAAVSLSI
jgi:hypothetical protein